MTRPTLRLLRSDGAVPHREWPDAARIVEGARWRYPTIACGWLPVLRVAAHGDLWLPTTGHAPQLVRRCDCETRGGGCTK